VVGGGKWIALTFSDHCDLSTVVIPEDGRHRLYSRWEERLKSLREHIKDWAPAEKADVELFIDCNLVHAKKQEWHLFDIRELTEDWGKTVAKRVVRLLDTA